MNPNMTSQTPKSVTFPAGLFRLDDLKGGENLLELDSTYLESNDDVMDGPETRTKRSIRKKVNNRNNDVTTFGVVVTNIAIGVDDPGFDSRVSQIGRCVANDLPPLQGFYSVLPGS